MNLNKEHTLWVKINNQNQVTETSSLSGIERKLLSELEQELVNLHMLEPEPPPATPAIAA